MKNKRIISCILLFCMLVTLNVLLFYVDKKTLQSQSYNQKNSVSIMVYDEDEEDYVRQNNVPIGDYSLNQELSYCEGRGSIEGYDNVLGIVTTYIKGSDMCYYYFEPALYAYTTIKYEYTGQEVEFTIPSTGEITIEAWGAQGGSGTKTGGYGAYATGKITLTGGTKLYINVGGQGLNGTSGTTISGGYNGGGDGYYASNGRGSGGGATSIALVSGELSTLSSHANDNQIIMVAAGGGGYGYYASNQYGDGGNGGGIQGNDGQNYYTGDYGAYVAAYGATQSAGGGGAATGTFGHGANAILTYDGNAYGGAGGGGGYYGGGAAHNNSGGGGGSSYIANSNLTDKHMTCYDCTTSAASNINTYTISNTCQNSLGKSDCSKTGDGLVKITYKELITNTTNENYEFTGNEQYFFVPKTGNYRIELWGAQGGSGTKTGGYGAYATGKISLTKGTKLYINVGGEGSNVSTGSDGGGYNGGGNAYSTNGTRGSGGGATSVALVSGVLSSLSSHANDNQIIMVAAGGGGYGYYASNQYGDGGNGGGIQGNDGQNYYTGDYGAYVAAYGGTQSAGGSGAVAGAFGKGADAIETVNSNAYGGAGGGGGYYGGGASHNNSGGGGGSSYIANNNLADKHMACYDCTTSAQSNTNTYTISNTCVNSTATSDCSKTGNGYAKISLIEGDTSNTFSSQDFTYTGEAQYFKVPSNGNYKLEVWGAEGGTTTLTGYTGGKGGYSTGIVSLTKNTELYIYVGQQGASYSVSSSTYEPTFGGGGGTTYTQSGYLTALGGGASDIRIGDDSIYARVIVAGGGGGGGGYSSRYGNGGHGGGTTGTTGTKCDSDMNNQGTQTGSSGQYAGVFGAAGMVTASNGFYWTGTGGGGWYGGGTSGATGGGGGSGYIYTSSTASNYPSECLLNSSYYLTSASTTAGNTLFTSPEGTSETGHSGNGYARITFIS